jgi:hypothetical protein
MGSAPPELDDVAIDEAADALQLAVSCKGQQETVKGQESIEYRRARKSPVIVSSAPSRAGSGRAVAPPELDDAAIDEAASARAMVPPPTGGCRAVAPPELDVAIDVDAAGRLEAFL